MHPFASVLTRLDAAIAELLELVEVFQLDFELKRRAFVGTSERTEQACLKRNPGGGLDFAANMVLRLTPL